ncbi:serine protease [Actinoplanes missouriensis]|uniref:S1 family peptidase n=1 Tax=Actinoplanes missouriensis TaxID=1866 RepID=UPI0033D6AA83
MVRGAGMGIPRRPVRVRSPREGLPGLRFGSGCLVASGLVLTASHVVPDERCEVLVDAGGPGANWLSGRVTARDEATDLAVVTVDGAGAGITRMPFGVLPADGGDPLGWDAVGYPVAGAEGEDRQPEEVRGTLPLGTAAGSGELGLTVETREAKVTTAGSGWAGLSGAPVFAGDTLIGVITDHPSAYHRGLTARALAAAPAHLLAALGHPPFVPVREGGAVLIRRHRERMSRRFSTLDLSAVPDHELADVRLDELYIQLEALPEPSSGSRGGGRRDEAEALAAVRALGEQAWSRVHEQYRRSEERLVLRNPGEVMREALERRRSVVVLGVPGGGKSTMLRALARDLAGGGDDAPVPLFGRLADFSRRNGDSLRELVFQDATRDLPERDRVRLRLALARLSRTAGSACCSTALTRPGNGPEACGNPLSSWPPTDTA